LAPSDSDEYDEAQNLFLVADVAEEEEEYPKSPSDLKLIPQKPPKLIPKKGSFEEWVGFSCS
jgi:hypothetical protein